MNIQHRFGRPARLAVILFLTAIIYFACLASNVFAERFWGQHRDGLTKSRTRLVTISQDHMTASVKFDGVDLHENEGVRFVIDWRTGPLDVRIFAPDGTTIDHTNIEDLPGGKLTTHTPNMLFKGKAETYEFRSRGAGTYRVELQVPKAPKKEMRCLVSMDSDSPIVTTSFMDAYHPTHGVPYVLTTAVFSSKRPFLNAQVTATVHHPSKTITELHFYDDGRADLHGDVDPNDGLYKALFTPPEAGHYKVNLTISGFRSPDLPFTRESFFRFAVGETVLAPGTPLHIYTVDKNDNDLADEIVIEAQDLWLRKAGEYQFTVNFATASGKTLQGGGLKEVEKAGKNTLQATIDAAEMLRVNEDGPYTVSFVSIRHWNRHENETLALIDHYGQTTDPYRVRQFERPPIRDFPFGASNAAIIANLWLTSKSNFDSDENACL